MIRPWSADRRASVGIVTALLLSGPAAARAQVAQDPALADALFKTGVEALAKGDYGTACPKFHASMELGPAVATLLNIAKCDLHENKLARAWATYQRALVLNRDTVGATRQRDLDEYTRNAIAALEPRLPRLRITVTPAVPGLSLRRDGETLPAAVLGEGMPTNPGPHHLEASAPGHHTEVREVVLQEGRTEALDITLSVEAPPPVVPPPIVTPPPVLTRVLPPEPPAAPRRAPGTPAWVLVAGGAGVVLAGVAVGFAVDGASTVARLHTDCPDLNGTPTCPQPKYNQTFVDGLNAEKNRDLAVAVAAGIGGSAALAAAVVGYVRGGARAQTSGWNATPWLGPGTAGLRLDARF